MKTIWVKALSIILCLTTAYNSLAALNEILVRPADIGPQWEGGTGVVIEDLADPPAFFAQSMAATIEQYQPIGVKSMANLAFRRKSNLTHQVELQIFVFDSLESATKWQQEKYGYDDWQAHYERIDDGEWVTYDSTQINKRIVFYQNYWITVASPEDAQDHQLFLSKLIDKINQNKSQ